MVVFECRSPVTVACKLKKMHDIDFREQGDIPGVLQNSITEPNLCLELNGIVFLFFFFHWGLALIIL